MAIAEFVTKIFRHDDKRWGYYVPQHVIAFYEIQPGTYDAEVALRRNLAVDRSLWTDIHNYRNGLRGYIPRLPEEDRLQSGSVVRIRISPYS